MANEITTDFYIGKDLENTSSEEYKSITTSKKISYSEGNDFTFDGSNYIGYYNYDGENFYKGKKLQNDILTINESAYTIYTVLETSYTLD